MSRIIYSSWLKIHLSLLGVSFGKKLTFYGYTKFFLGRENKLFIGNNVVFRSSKFSNLIGINRPCILSILKKNAKVLIGDNCGFSGTVIGCFSEISLGQNVRCGANTLITDSDWHLNDSRTSDPLPIIIQDDVWLGTNVVVLKGVTIGKGSIIGAGSVVTKDIPSNVIAAGNPCVVIKVIGNINEN